MSKISHENYVVEPGAIAPADPVAVVYVGESGELGFHLLSALLNRVPYLCRNVLFYAVDSNRGRLLSRERRTAERRDASVERLNLHVEAARRRGLNAAFRYAAGIDPLEEAENLCASIAEHFPQATFYFCRPAVAGQKDACGPWVPELRERLSRLGLATATLPLTAEDFVEGAGGAEA